MSNQEVGADFGLAWDPEAALVAALEEEQARREKRPLDSLKPKLTPAQKRDAALKELKEAIAAQDDELVRDVLLSHPKLVIAGTPFDLEKEALTNFNPVITQQLLDRGMMFNMYAAVSVFQNINSLEALSFLYDHFSAPVASTDPTRQRNHLNQLEGMRRLYHVSIDGLRSKMSSEKRLMFKGYREFLEAKFPDIFANFLKSSGYKVLLNNITPKSPVYEKELLWRTKDDNWVPVLKEKFSASNFSHSSKSFNADSMQAFREMMMEFDFLKPAFEKSQKLLAQEHQKRNDWFDAYFGDVKIPSDSLYYKELKDLVLEPRGPLHYYSHSHGGGIPRLLGQTFDQQKSAQKFEKILGWSAMEYARFINDKTMAYNFAEYKKKDGSQSQMPACPKYEAPSFLHLLMSSGAPVVSVLANDPKSHASIMECLNDEDTAFLFIKNISVQDLAVLIKKVPEMLEWRDAHGNTLAHLMCVVQSEVTKTGAQALLRAAHSLFGEENAQGFDLRKTYEHMGANETTLTEIDKTMMKKELGAIADIRKKVHARNTTKRRM